MFAGDDVPCDIRPPSMMSPCILLADVPQDCVAEYDSWAGSSGLLGCWFAYILLGGPRGGVFRSTGRYRDCRRMKVSFTTGKMG